MRGRTGRAVRTVATVGSILLLASGAEAHAQQAPESPSPPPPPDANTAKAAAQPDETQAAAALRAAQEMEARMLEMRRELDGLERQRASWDDIRARLDGVDARLQSLSREVGGAGAPPSRDEGTPSVRFLHGGFLIRSPDDTFAFHPSMRLQAGWVGQLADAGSYDPARPDASTFSLLHAQLSVDGHAVTPRLQYRVQVDLAETPVLEDAFLQFRVAPWEVVRLGRFKVPYAEQRLIYSGELEFVDVSVATAAFSLERDVGLMVEGRPFGGRLRYQLAVLNGALPDASALPQGRNDNLDFAYAARIVASPFGPLPSSEGDMDGQARPLASLGIAGYYNLVPTDVRLRTGNPSAPLDVDGNGRIDNVSVWQAAVQLRALFRGAALQAEWFGRRESPGVVAADRSSWGAYVQASYFVLPHRIEIAARASRTDLPLYGAALDERLRRGTSVDEESAAVSAYLRGHHAKLQLAYSHLVAQHAGSAPVVDRLQAAAQLWF